MAHQFKAFVNDSQLRGWRRQGITYEQICRSTGMTISEVSRRLRTLYSVPKSPDPSPEAIAAECEKIRAGWSAEEREQRYVGQSTDWQPTVVPVSVVASALG